MELQESFDWPGPYKQTSVLIVGAGPPGLMIASQLAASNIPFRIVDKNEHAATGSGALFIQARSMEILDQMGLAQKITELGTQAQKINILFKGRKPLDLDLQNMGKGLSKFRGLMMLEQSKTEQILVDHLSSFDHVVERETEVLGFYQKDDDVISILRRSDGSEEILKTSYLIAADGGHSFIRNKLEIPFHGTTHKLTLFVLDCETSLQLSNKEIYFYFSENDSTGIFPLREGWRIDGTLPKELDGHQQIIYKDIKNKLSARIQMNIKDFEVRQFSIFHSHQQYAERFSLNKVFLIGDAAHVLSPVGAQGMNTGLQDAYNIAWKLSSVIRGKVRASILNSYQKERQPLAKKLVRSTDVVFKLVTGQGYMVRKFRMTLMPGLVSLLLTLIERQRNIGQALFKGISETGIRYAKSPLSRKGSQGIFMPGTPRPGDRFPYLQYSENGVVVNMQDRISNPAFHLFIFDKVSPWHDVRTVKEKYQDLLTVEFIPYTGNTAIIYKKLGIRKNGLYLVRPDIHIMYRSNRVNFRKFARFFDQFLNETSEIMK